MGTGQRRRGARQDENAGDTTTIQQTLIAVAEQVEKLTDSPETAEQIAGNWLTEVVADKGYYLRCIFSAVRRVKGLKTLEPPITAAEEAPTFAVGECKGGISMKKNMMVYVLAVLAVVWLPKSAASQNGSDAGSITAGGIRDAVIALAADARSLLDTATLEFNCRLNPQTFCQAYIGGVTDTFIGLGREGILAGDGKRHLCVPNGVNGLQLARLFMKYVQDHPETLHEDAVPTIFLALYSAFPCPN